MTPPPDYPPARARGRGRAWYHGDCHVHSTHSDGELTPAELAAAARAAGLDFVATTEHNTAAGHAAWTPYAGDDLLVILGAEVTTPTGHWLALGLPGGRVVDWRDRARDGAIADRLAEVHAAGGLCVAAHPHAPYRSGTFMYPYDGFDAVEVWNGEWSSDRPWNADNAAAVAEWGRRLGADVHSGRWRPAAGNSDTHLPGQIGVPRTVVLADELGTDAILAGIRAGRSWIAGGAGIDLTLDATAGDGRAGIGDRLATGGRPVTVRVRITGVAGGAVTVHTDEGAAYTEVLAADGPGIVGWTTSAAESSHVRVEVRHPDGRMAALTNPVVLT
ncbi:MAG TPA: CehA/McbA family metallohydrolase [Actinocatenispora sp.]